MKRLVYVFIINFFILFPLVSSIFGEETSSSFISSLTNISWTQGDDEDIFKIDITGGFDFSYAYLQSPYRFFIDISPVESKMLDSEIPVENDGIEKIRLARQDEKKLRVVFDLSGPIRYKDIVKDSSGITVSFPPRLKKVSIDVSAGNKGFLNIITGSKKVLLPEVFSLVNPNRIVIDIPNTTLMNDTYSIQVSPPITEVKVSQFSIYPPTVRVVISSDNTLSWSLEEIAVPGVISLSFPMSSLTPPVLKPIIIIDPGHGGKDPGAIGPSGLKEKDVTLDVALYMKGLLESNGYQVILTRSTDSSVAPNGNSAREELEARVVLINGNRKAILVSVHCNSANSPIPGGIEVFYCRDEDKPFAESVCNSLSNATGRYNRGVKKGDFFIIKNVNIPAILVEALFISNPTEEKFLMDSLFRRKIAGGIVSGIIAFLEGKQ
ncbi:MAG: N-acetylmuramoyl-L-alanine amidase [bacterium]